MGRHDVAAYEYLSQAEHFADLFNAKFFGGRPVVDSEKLLEADGRTGGNGKNSQYRDIIKRLPNGARFVILAIENQDNVDYEMPWRIMGYDHAEYRRQIRQIHKQKRLGDFPMEFNDYQMHLVCADDVGLAENCNTQLGLLLRVLAARGDRKQMEVLKNSGELDNLDAETGKAIAELADMPKLLEYVENDKQDGKDGEYSMCVAIDEMVEEGRQEGILQALISLVKDSVLTVEQAAERAHISVSEFEAKAKEL